MSAEDGMFGSGATAAPATGNALDPKFGGGSTAGLFGPGPEEPMVDFNNILDPKVNVAGVRAGGGINDNRIGGEVEVMGFGGARAGVGQDEGIFADASALDDAIGADVDVFGPGGGVAAARGTVGDMTTEATTDPFGGNLGTAGVRDLAEASVSDRQPLLRMGPAPTGAQMQAQQPPTGTLYATDAFKRKFQTGYPIDNAQQKKEIYGLSVLTGLTLVLSVGTLAFAISPAMWALAGFRYDAWWYAFWATFILAIVVVFAWILHYKYSFHSIRSTPMRSRAYWTFYWFLTFGYVVFASWWWVWLTHHQKYSMTPLPGCGKKDGCADVPGRNPGPDNSPIPEAEAFAAFMQLNINWVLFMVFVFVFAVRLAMIASATRDEMMKWANNEAGAEPRAPSELVQGDPKAQGFSIQEVGALKIGRTMLHTFYAITLIFLGYMFWYTFHFWIISMTADPNISVDGMMWAHVAGWGLWFLQGILLIVLYYSDRSDEAVRQLVRVSRIGGKYNYHWDQYFTMSTAFFLILGLNSIFFGHAAQSDTNTSEHLKYDPTPDAASGVQPDLWYRWNGLSVINGAYSPWVTYWIIKHLWLAPLLYPTNRKTVIVSGQTKQFGLVPNLGFTGAVQSGQTQQRLYLGLLTAYLVIVHTLVVFLDLQEQHVINKGMGAWIIFFTAFSIFAVAVAARIVYVRVTSFRTRMAQAFRRLRGRGGDEGPAETTSAGPGNEAVLICFFFVLLHSLLQVTVFYWYVDDVYDGRLKTSDLRNPLSKEHTAYWNMLGHGFLQVFIWKKIIGDSLHTLNTPEIQQEIAKDGSLLNRFISAAARAPAAAAGAAAAALRGTTTAVRNITTMGGKTARQRQ